MVVHLLVIDADHFFRVTLVWSLVPLALGFYYTYLVGHEYWRHRRPQHGLLLGTGVFIVALGVHDWMIQNGTLNFSHPHLMQYGAPLLLVVFAISLITRFVDALNTVETLNEELEGRVAAESEELEKKLPALTGLGAPTRVGGRARTHHA